MSVEILFLGTAGAMPSVERDNTSIAIRFSGSIYLIETPGSLVYKMLKVGFDPLAIRYVFITHIHPDHSYGLPSLLHILKMLQGEISVNIMIPEPFVDDMNEILRRFDLLHSARVRPLPLEKKMVLKEPSLSIDVFPVLHTISNVGLRFVIYDGDRTVKIVYSSDTEFCENVISASKGADILIHECNESEVLTGGKVGHSTAREAGRVAALSGVEKLVLVHLGPELLMRPEVAISEAKQEFYGDVICPKDLEILSL